MLLGWGYGLLRGLRVPKCLLLRGIILLLYFYMVGPHRRMLDLLHVTSKTLRKYCDGSVVKSFLFVYFLVTINVVIATSNIFQVKFMHSNCEWWSPFSQVLESIVWYLFASSKLIPSNIYSCKLDICPRNTYILLCMLFLGICCISGTTCATRSQYTYLYNESAKSAVRQTAYCDTN